jgi:hypothetical protein
MIGVLAAVALAATAESALPLAPSHDGGVCIGFSWAALQPGETAHLEEGPDFRVFRFQGPGEQWWGVYSGNFAQVEGNGELLISRDGVVIHRASKDGKFRGYLAQKGSWQNHFFGSVFHGDSGDKAFFDRIDTSAKGQALCSAGLTGG